MNDQKNKSPYTTLSAVPVNLKAEQPQAQQTTEISPDNSRRWLILSALILILALAFVGFILPTLIGIPEATDLSTAPRPNSPPTSLYQRELASKYRQNAQEVIPQIADMHVELEKLNVLQWATEDFIAAKAQAKVGDTLFRQQNYKASIGAYQDALVQMQKLRDRWPIFLRNALNATEASLAAGSLAEAKQQIQELLKIAPANQAAGNLKERVEARFQILALLAESKALLANNQLSQAVAKLQQAIQLDPAFATTQKALEEVRLALHNKAFRVAMSKALVAMNESRFDDAVMAFTEANRLQPSPESQARLRDAKRRLLIEKLRPLKQRVEQAEKAENWTQAVSTYTQMLELEASPDIAGQLKRSKNRLTLDKKITAWLADTNILNDNSERQSAQRVLKLLAQIEPKGVRLQSQLEQLKTALKLAVQPIKLILTSGGSTAVRLYRVDSYKPFQQLELSLKPGEYTALGTRRGYRDVIHKFTLRPGTSPFQLDIRCEEQI